MRPAEPDQPPAASALPRTAAVLILDDDPGILTLQRRSLQRAGYRVTTAATAEEALAAVRREPPDLLMLDYRLDSSTTGLDVHRRLREEGLKIPAILVSGFNDENRVLEALRVGIRDVVPKGGDYLEYLPQAVERVLEQIASERKAFEAEALRQSEQTFRAFFEQAAVGAVQADPVTLRFIRVNDAYCRLTGYSRERLLEMSIFDLTHPEDRERDQSILARWAQGEAAACSVEKRYLRSDGSIIWVSVSTSLVRDPQGQPLHTVSIVSDITARKQAEQQLRQNEATLSEAKRAAEQANYAKDHFLAVLSHELRTPLTPVTAALSILEDDPRLPADIRGELAMVQRNVELETRLIDDLLDLTRVSRGKIALDRRLVSIDTILEHVAEVCESDLEAKNLHFKLELLDRRLTVEGDPARLQQVFWNILKNAIKFTSSGGCIGARLWHEDARAVVEVTDSGRGIDPLLLPHIFNAFEQGSHDITRQFGGLGLGLTICRTLVDLHGGRISARSEGIGHGATFRVELPLTQAPAAMARPVGRPTGQQPLRRPGHAPLNILLVEDHVDTARIMKRFLAIKGHTVTTAGDVAGALGEARQGQFDLLVSDLGLPDGSGLDVIRTLRKEGHALPAIALSGYGQEEDLQRSRAAGFTEHLVKPIDVRRLQDTIERVVLASPQHRSGQDPASSDQS